MADVHLRAFVAYRYNCNNNRQQNNPGNRGARLVKTISNKVLFMVQDKQCRRDNPLLGSAFIDDLGYDSLDMIQAVMDAEDAFGVEISDSEAEKIITVQDAVTLIESKLKQGLG